MYYVTAVGTLRIKTWFGCFLCIKFIWHFYYNSYLALTVNSNKTEKRSFRKGDGRNIRRPPDHVIRWWTSLKWTNPKNNIQMITIQICKLLYLILLHALSLAAISPIYWYCSVLLGLRCVLFAMYPAHHTLIYNSFFQCLWRNYFY